MATIKKREATGEKKLLGCPSFPLPFCILHSGLQLLIQKVVISVLCLFGGSSQSVDFFLPPFQKRGSDLPSAEETGFLHGLGQSLFHYGPCKILIKGKRDVGVTL